MQAIGRAICKWPSLFYIVSMAMIMLGYVRYDPYQIDGDAVSYMDLAGAIAHGRWSEIVNGLWNPGYPALLAVGKLLTHADRMHELQTYYWVNYFIFLISIACTAFFVRSVISVRSKMSSETHPAATWMLPEKHLYVVAYAIVFLSWQHEFSLGKIRVDGLFAALLLLALGSLLRTIYSTGFGYPILSGIAFGLAYLVKSPGLIVAIIAFLLFSIYLFSESKLKRMRWKLFALLFVFAAVAGPYIAALSLQKGRLDAGDSGRLNYAWCVSGTQPLHLLNNQPSRFGNANVQLKHAQIELLSNPVVVSFVHFPHATYGPWFDPSYFNEGVVPRFNLRLQLRLMLDQSRILWGFLETHSPVIALFLLSIVLGAALLKNRTARNVMLFLYVLTFLCFLMYLCVHFLDRYVGGLFWVASIATFGMLVLKNEFQRNSIQGAAIFMEIVFLLLGCQAIAQMKQVAFFNGQSRGWQNNEEFQAAKKLKKDGVPPGSTVACFRACNTGAYWARLAGVHVTSEIFDPRYIADTGDGRLMWNSLPNKASVVTVLKKNGARAIVGYFELPPNDNTGWKQLSGHYYIFSLN